MSQITPTQAGGIVAKQFNKLPTPGKTGVILGILDALIFLGFWVFGGITRAIIVAFILVACEAGILVLLRLRNHRRNPKTVDSELVSQKEHFDPTIEDTTPEPTPLPELPPPTLKRQLGLFGGVAVLLLIVLLTWTTADNWIVPSVVTFIAIILGTGWLLLFKRRKEIEWPLPVGTKVLFPVSPAEQWKVNQQIVITKDPINLLPRRPILVLALIVGLAILITSVPVVLYFYPEYTVVPLSVIGLVLAVFAFDAAYFCLWDSRYNFAILDSEGLKIYQSWIRKNKKNYPRGAWLSANMVISNFLARAWDRDCGDIAVLIADEEDAHLLGVAFASEVLDIIQDLIHRESQLAEDDATIQRAQLDELRDLREAVTTNTALMAFLAFSGDPDLLTQAYAHFTSKQLELMGFPPPEFNAAETLQLPAVPDPNKALEPTARIIRIHGNPDDPTQP
jgi:hypothetical protein